MPEGILDAICHWYDQTTLYDRLTRRSSHGGLLGDIPQSLILVHQLERERRNYAKLQKFLF